MTLPQQLEDKKKELDEIGCGFTGNVEEDDWYECGVDDYLCDDCEIEKIKLTAEIAILEQAIAEIKNIQSHIYRGNSSKEKDNERVPISESATDELNNESKAHSQLSLQKQRQDFAEKLKERIMRNGNLSGRIVKNKDGEFEHKHDYVLNEIVCLIIDDELQQLNQPKTEDHAHHTNCPLERK